MVQARMREPWVIALASQMSGVGKTTLALELASVFADTSGRALASATFTVIPMVPERAAVQPKRSSHSPKHLGEKVKRALVHGLTAPEAVGLQSRYLRRGPTADDAWSASDHGIPLKKKGPQVHVKQTIMG